MPRFTNVATLGSDRDPREVFERIAQARQAIGELQDVAILDGRLLENVTVDGQGTSIAHGLGRRIRGWILTRWPEGAVIEEQTTQSDPSRFLDVQIRNEETVAGAGDFVVNQNNVSVAPASRRIQLDSASVEIFADFPGPVGSQILGLDFYGENPSASVRGITNSLTVSTDKWWNSESDVATDSPATTANLEWTSTFDTSTSGFPVTTASGVNYTARCLGASGAGTDVYVYSARWLYALAPSAVVSIWVF